MISVIRQGSALIWENLYETETVELNKGYFLHGEIVVKLPQVVVKGDQVGWRNIEGVQIIHGNGNKIEGEDKDLEIDVLGASGILVFQGEEYGWMNVTEVKGANKFALENYLKANEDHLLVEKGHPKVMVPLIQHCVLGINIEGRPISATRYTDDGVILRVLTSGTMTTGTLVLQIMAVQ